MTSASRIRASAAIGLAATLVSLAHVTPAQAQEKLQLSWQAPSGCPQESAVREQIRALVPAALLEQSRLSAEGTVTRLESRYRLTLVLHLDDVTGERSIESDSCGDLAGAAAVALVLLLQASIPEEAAPASPPAPPVAPRPEPQDPPSKPAPRARDRRFRVLVQPELAVDVGPLAEPIVTLGLAAGLAVDHFQLMLDARLPATQHVALAPAIDVGADLEHSVVSLSVCHAWRMASLEVAPCLSGALERLRATGTGAFVAPRSEAHVWSSFGASGGARFYVSDWLALSVGVSARVEAARPRISIAGLDATEVTGPAVFGLRAGPTLVF